MIDENKKKECFFFLRDGFFRLIFLFFFLYYIIHTYRCVRVAQQRFFATAHTVKIQSRNDTVYIPIYHAYIIIMCTAAKHCSITPAVIRFLSTETRRATI